MKTKSFKALLETRLSKSEIVEIEAAAQIYALMGCRPHLVAA